MKILSGEAIVSDHHTHIIPDLFLLARMMAYTNLVLMRSQLGVDEFPFWSGLKWLRLKTGHLA